MISPQRSTEPSSSKDLFYFAIAKRRFSRGLRAQSQAQSQVQSRHWVALILALLLMIASCVPSVGIPGSSGSWPAPLLGIVVDENLRVIDLEPGSPAEKAEIQKGDVLFDLTWVATATQDEANAEEAPAVDENNRIVTPIPPERVIDTSPILFTDKEKINELIRSGAIVKLRLQRGDQIMEITMQAARPAIRPNAITATPLWEPNDLF